MPSIFTCATPIVRSSHPSSWIRYHRAYRRTRTTSNESVVTTTMPIIAGWRRSSAKNAAEYSEEYIVHKRIFEEFRFLKYEMNPRRTDVIRQTSTLPSPTTNLWLTCLGILSKQRSDSTLISEISAAQHLINKSDHREIVELSPICASSLSPSLQSASTRLARHGPTKTGHDQCQSISLPPFQLRLMQDGREYYNGLYFQKL